MLQRKGWSQCDLFLTKEQRAALQQEAGMSTNEDGSAQPPDEREDRRALAQEVVWARIHALESMETQVSQIEDLLVKLVEVQQSLHAQIQDDLSAAINIATTKRMVEPQRVQHPFSFYLNKLIHMLKP